MSSSTRPPFDVRDFFDRLVNAIQDGKLTEAITAEMIQRLLSEVKRVFRRQPVFLKINAPVHVCGDLHGQFNDVIRIFGSEGFPDMRNYLFLGDYVDRGTQSVELILFMFACKLRYPANFFMLRGNHETESVNRAYGFRKDVMDKYRSDALFEAFQKVFEMMPLSALISNRILCMHGGLSPQLVEASSLDVLNRIPRPLKDEAIAPNKNQLAQDLLWADPDVSVPAFGKNRRGISNTFGQDVINRVRQRFGIDLILRAHQVVLDGYEFFDGRISSGLITLFSAPHYCGTYDNSGAVIRVSVDLQVSLKCFRPQFGPRPIV